MLRAFTTNTKMRNKQAPKTKTATQITSLGMIAEEDVDVVAILPTGKTYIFEMKIKQWLTMKKKPGVQYSAFQKGFAQFKDAIRTEYNR